MALSLKTLAAVAEIALEIASEIISVCPCWVVRDVHPRTSPFMAATPEAAATSEAEARAALEAATLAVIEKHFQELMQALAWSPPALLAWSFGYLNTINLLAVLALMLAPWLTGKAVEAMGGRGAWAPMIDAAKKKMEVPAVLRLPTSIFLGPFILMTVVREESTSTTMHALLLAAVYLFLCAANYAREKMFPTVAANKPEDESSKSKAKGVGSSKKQR